MPGAKRRDYEADEARILGIWHRSKGTPIEGGEEAVRSATGCTAADAFRVVQLRRAAVPSVQALWETGALTLRQAERIATTDPFNSRAQKEAARVYPEARALLDREAT